MTIASRTKEEPRLKENTHKEIRKFPVTENNLVKTGKLKSAKEIN